MVRENIMCLIYKSDYHEKYQNWKGNNRIVPERYPQEVLIKCDGKMHHWQDNKLTNWGAKCPDIHLVIVADKVDRPADQVKTFDNFNIKVNDFRSQVTELQSYLGDMFLKKCFLIGKPGLGKSHLAEACLNHLLPKGIKVVFYSGVELAKIFKSQIDGDYDRMQLNNWLNDNDYIIIDDLQKQGQGSTKTEFFQERFCDFLDKFRGKLIITNNVPIPELQFSDQIKSRLNEDLKVIVFSGVDYRREK